MSPSRIPRPGDNGKQFSSLFRHPPKPKGYDSPRTIPAATFRARNSCGNEGERSSSFPHATRSKPIRHNSRNTVRTIHTGPNDTWYSSHLWSSSPKPRISIHLPTPFTRHFVRSQRLSFTDQAEITPLLRYHANLTLHKTTAVLNAFIIHNLPTCPDFFTRT